MSRRWLTAALVFCIFSAACSQLGVEDTTPSEPTVTSSSYEPIEREANEYSEADEQTGTGTTGAVGADGIGDRLFPDLGNGGYDVSHYDLTLDVFDELTATARITLTPTVDLDRFSLDFIGLEVDAISVNGDPTSFGRAGSELRVDPQAVLKANEVAEVIVEYHGQPQPLDDPTAPLALGWRTEQWGTFTFSEPIGSATWFPSNDHPLDKATYTFTVSVPAGQVAVASGTLTDRTDRGDRSTFVWEIDQPMATYLASVATGRFDIVTDREGPVLIRNVFPSERADDLLVRINDTDAMMRLFIELFGPYPFDVYGIIVVDADLSGAPALENQTLSVFSLRLFTSSSDGFLRKTLAHELAHQWFGNHVSVGDWSDIWLNEGFASWAELYWAEQVGLGSFDEEAARDYPPLLGRSVETLFDSEVYTRGALALEALRQTVGDDAFFDLLRTWVARFGGGSATTEDFFSLVDEQLGPIALALVDSWVNDKAMPDLPSS